ncbi:MAG: hypothetical protein EBR82_61365 [Caulobacteraceae bacterium]|nr:hypothetical protein [Caulobacteraceae bacterium]
MEEVWKDCYGWESFYEVSNLGNIRSKKRPVPTQFGITTRGGVSIKKIVAKNGYECVNLTGGGKRRQELVHRLVLLSFIGEPEKGRQACHNDGVRHNNKLQNLRWDSISGNHADKKKHGTWQIGEKNPYAKLTNQQAREIKNSKESLKVLAKKYGVSVGCISRVQHKQSWVNI